KLRHGGFRLPAASVKTDAFQGSIDFFQRLLAEVRNAQQIFSRAVQQVVDRKDASLFEAIGRSNRKADFGRTHFQAIVQVILRVRNGRQWNSSSTHGFPPVRDKSRRLDPTVSSNLRRIDQRVYRLFRSRQPSERKLAGKLAESSC